MMDKTYSTGQVSGMLDIPIRTIQDYVKCFREYFSEAARQPSKGRRFTDADIKTLQTIRRARSERITDDEIKKIISGEIDLPLAQEHKDADIKQMAFNAYEKMEMAMIIFKDCERAISESEKVLARMRNENETLKIEVNTLKNRVDKMREWQIFVMKTDPLFNPNQEDQPAQDAGEKKKGFFEKLMG